MQILDRGANRRVLDALGRLASETVAQRAIGPVIRATVEAFATALAPRCVALYLIEHGALKLAGHRGLAPETAAAITRLAADSPALAAAAARARELQVIADVRTPPPALAGAAEGAGAMDAGSLLAVPLLAGGDLVGVVQAGFGAAPELAPRELEALRALAAMAALALHDAHARRAEERLQSQVELIIRAGLAISDTLAILPEPHLQAALQRGFRNWPLSKDRRIPQMLQAVLQSIVEHARLAAGAELAALGIGDDPSRSFEPWVFSGVSPEVAAHIGRHPRPVATLGVVAREGQDVRVADLTQHPAYAGLPAGHPPLKAMLGVPIRYRGMNLGNLYLCNKIGADEFTDEDHKAVELLASHAALAFQQAYLRSAIGAQRTQMQILLDAAPHGILFLDAASGEVIANPRATQLLGRTLGPGDGAAQLAGAVLRPDGRPLAGDELPSRRALRGESVATQELLVARPDGTRVPVLWSAAPVRGLDDEVAGAIAIFEDISAWRELDRLREEFAAVVAHDLRTPIQTILLQVHLMNRGPDGEDVTVPRGAVHRIEQSAIRLNRMAGDLLEATRIDLRRLALDLKPVAAGAAAALVERIRPTLGAHPVAVEIDGTPPPAAADPGRLDQILTNLIENAAKYSPAASPITVRVAARDGGVELAVSDRGVGIAEEEIPRLFERYYQSARARERKTGLGLGLYITRGLVEAHHGRITVESELDKGSTFRVWLPAAT